MPSLNDLLWVIQYDYLNREDLLMAQNPGIGHEQLIAIVQADPVCRRLKREEHELLTPTTSDYENQFADPYSCREWDRRKKYRGKADGAKQPTKVRIARRRKFARQIAMLN